MKKVKWVIATFFIACVALFNIQNVSASIKAVESGNYYVGTSGLLYWYAQKGVEATGAYIHYPPKFAKFTSA